MIGYPQSVAARVLLKLYLSSDHVSVATGKTVAVVISKNGGAFANPSAGATNATEIGNGWYYVDLSTTDLGTLGPVIVRGTAASCDDSEYFDYVINANNGGLAFLDAAVSSRSTYAGADTSGTTTLLTRIASALTITGGKVDVNDKTGFSLTQAFPTNFSALSIDATGVAKANLAQILGTGLTETSGQIAAGFKQFFNIASPTSTMNTVTAVTTATNLTNAPTSGDLTATMKTSVTTAATAATPTVSLSAAAVTAIWAALTSSMTTVGSVGKLIATNLDALISSRMATFTYTAPDNATIGTISTAVSALPTANQNADALLDRTDGIETGRTPRQGLRLMLAALAGKLSGAATTTVVIRDTNDLKDRISATVDSSGNRSAITYDVT